jgi:iron complex transport system substrate-binding protein
MADTWKLALLSLFNKNMISYPMKRYLTKICVATLIFCLLISGETATREATAGESIRIKDATGRSVQVKLPVKKLVVLTSDALEVIRALKAEDLVSGVNTGIAKDPLFWPGLKNKPIVGSWRGPNYELIVELNPDIVIGYGRHPGQDMEKKLEPFGIKK